MSEDKGYEVGYGKPPKSTQFQPGQSGNPKGRPRGIKNLNTDLEEELNERLLVNEAGNPREITKQRAILKSMFAKAIKGDTRAASVLINLILGLEQARIADSSGESLGEDDLAILEAFRERVLSDSTASPGA